MGNSLIKEKTDFFKEGKFRINLSFDETDKKVLIPGHRFIPFLNMNRNPNSIIIYDKHGEKLKSRIIEVNPETIKQYYSLFGLDNFLFLLIRDKEENSRIIMSDSKYPKKFLITVYNIEPLFSNMEKRGSSLSMQIRIRDWEKGVYEAELVEKESEEEKNISVWVETLEKGLLKADENNYQADSIEEFLSTAFYLGGEYLIKHPSVTLEEFQELSDKNFISRFHSKSETSRILEKSKHDLNRKIDLLIKKLVTIENKIISGEMKEDSDKKITLDKISNTISTLRSFSTELDSPDINEEKLNIIIRIIYDSEKLTDI